MFSFAIALMFAIQGPAQPAAQDEIKDGLLRAESLFYEARFIESIQLLAHVNDVLQTKPGRVPDKIAAKLQLALANIGLNDTASAKSFLSEVYALDPDYVIDVKQFSPKVVSLANDAKNDQLKTRCQEAGDNARRALAAGDATGIQAILGTMKSKCPELADVEPETAELLYKTGLAQYKRSEFPQALGAFRSALKLAPKHEMTIQYLELTESKLQVAQDRLVLQWQKNFDARLFKEAAKDYREIVSLGDYGNPQALNKVTTEYRKALAPMVENWNQVCSYSDASTVAQLRAQITDFLPEPNFGEDIRSRMASCTVAARTESRTELTPNKIEAPRESKTNPSSGCLPMDPQLALARLKTKVEPEIPREARAYFQNSQISIRLKTRIDQGGNVAVSEVNGTNVIINNSVRTAVEKWKFSPIVDASGPRCVDTEILVMVGK